MSRNFQWLAYDATFKLKAINRVKMNSSVFWLQFLHIFPDILDYLQGSLFTNIQDNLLNLYATQLPMTLGGSQQSKQ